MEFAEIFDEYGHPVTVEPAGNETGPGTPFPKRVGPKYGSRRVTKPLPHFASLLIHGKWIFMKLPDGEVNYIYRDLPSRSFVHNCDVRTFGIFDLLAAASQCEHQDGIPTRAWFVHPHREGKLYQKLMPLATDEDVRSMFWIKNIFEEKWPEVYIQESEYLKGTGSEATYIIPEQIPVVDMKMRRSTLETRVQEVLNVRAKWTADQKRLEEYLGHTWYISRYSKPKLTCRNPNYSLRHSPYRGIVNRKMLVDEDPLEGVILD